MTAGMPRAAPERRAGDRRGRTAGPAVLPPSVPLSFLAAASAGLAACGAVLIWARNAAVADPTADSVVAAVHLGVLATLSMAVLGALHQFTPVVTHKPLRSLWLAWATFVTWIAASWLIPLGVAAEQEGVVEAGGSLAAVAIALLVVNLWAALLVRGKGIAVTGLRLAIVGLVVVACYGATYVTDRRGNWFDLTGHIVLAHAVVGLFGWLGLTYVTLAGRLWPMFLLANVPGRRRLGTLAVWAVPAGVALLSPGLLLGVAGLAWAGAVVLAGGLAAHLTSLLVHLHRRRRHADLFLTFVVTSAIWLLAGAGLALAATLVVGRDHHLGTALAAAAVTAIAGWLLEALAGHAHRVVPLIIWPMLRAQGAPEVKGVPLGVADLHNRHFAAAAYGLLTAGLAATCTGLAASSAAAIAAGGGLLAAAGIVMGVNLAVVPARVLRRPAAGQAAASGRR